ncbi:enoyl-[acyl-carrier-protein] reductase, mitochondrial-like [Procambarus clarkii]|uniref:enoyl-[acyl-carrier-protein] reductase, mitochondrial-like n=1 Tax=Procambarus clarkii TaxID=6728 RepID=UPI0037421B91
MLGRPALRRFALYPRTNVFANDIQRFRQFSGVGTSLVYEEYGDPEKVIVQTKTVLPKLQDDQVLIRMIAAPVNPADINTIQGVYAVKPRLPSVPGNEGVGEILDVGKNIGNELQPGDRIIPKINAFGTWCTHALASPSELIKVLYWLNNMVIQYCIHN